MERKNNLHLRDRLIRLMKILLIPGLIVGVLGLSFLTNSFLDNQVNASIPHPTSTFTSTPEGGICNVSRFTGFTNISVGKVSVPIAQYTTDHVPCASLTATPAPTSTLGR